MNCGKRAFTSPEQAHRQLRIWQQRGRRAELDNGHVYQCGEGCVPGTFHIGRKHDKTPGRPKGVRPHNYAEQRDRILDEVEDLFDHQRLRILGTVSKAERRRRERFAKADEGALLHGDNGTLCPQGDEFDVHHK